MHEITIIKTIIKKCLKEFKRLENQVKSSVLKDGINKLWQDCEL